MNCHENSKKKTAKKTAMNVKEATELIELGFEYVTGEYSDGGKIFRKRKTMYLGSGAVPAGSWSSMDSSPRGEISRKTLFLRSFNFYIIWSNS